MRKMETRLCIILGVVCFITGGQTMTTTGGYSEASTGTISTPDYPTNYTANMNRIWVLQAPVDYGVQLEVGPVTGETDDAGECADWLEIRDGSDSANLLLKTCSTTANTTVKSTHQWMWIRFQTNWEIEGDGFAATWSHYLRSNTNETPSISPFPRCRGNEIRCPNKQCVPMSWRCDGYNDCGFEGTYSDEDWWCFATAMSTGEKYAYGFSIGVVFFILVILLVAWLDGQFASLGRCGRGPKSCLGLDRLRQGPRTRRLPSYTGQTPAMLLLTGQHEKFEQLAAEEWQKRTEAYEQEDRRRRASMISLESLKSQPKKSEPIPQTKPASIQRKGQDKLKLMRSAREQVPEVPLTRDAARRVRPRPWLDGAAKPTENDTTVTPPAVKPTKPSGSKITPVSVEETPKVVKEEATPTAKGKTQPKVDTTKKPSTDKVPKAMYSVKTTAAKNSHNPKINSK